MLRRFVALVGAFALVPLAVASTTQPAGAATARVEIDGTRFLVDGAPTNDGTDAEGLLLNSRMVNALFDDENSATRSMWEYPDTDTWSAQRNVDELTNRWAGTGSCIARWVPTGEPDVPAGKLKGGMF